MSDADTTTPYLDDRCAGQKRDQFHQFCPGRYRSQFGTEFKCSCRNHEQEGD